MNERINQSLLPLSFFSWCKYSSKPANNLCLSRKCSSWFHSVICTINCKVMCYERGYLIWYYQVIFPLHGLAFTAASRAHGSSDKAALWQGSYWLPVPLETQTLHSSCWQQKWPTCMHKHTDTNIHTHTDAQKYRNACRNTDTQITACNNSITLNPFSYCLHNEHMSGVVLTSGWEDHAVYGLISGTFFPCAEVAFIQIVNTKWVPVSLGQANTTA